MQYLAPRGFGLIHSHADNSRQLWLARNLVDAMPTLKYIRLGIATVLHLTLALTIYGQNTSPSNSSQPAHNTGIVRVEGIAIPPILDAPFSARVLLELTETLPDGTTATHKTFNTIARDSQGRTRNEVRFWNPSNGSEPNLNYGTLYEPSSHVRTYIYPGTHFAREFVVSLDSSIGEQTSTDSSVPPVQKEDLGVNSRDGLRLVGSRETVIYPSGNSASPESITVTKEIWYSPELQIVFSIKRTDPRIGTQTVVVTDLKREEPSASLLLVPPEYRRAREPSLDNLPPVGGYVPPQRVKMGGATMAAAIVNRVQPVYPEEARERRVSGTVRLHVIVAKDGSIQQIEVISGDPLLVEASIDAVRRWRYRPILLNGQPVEVDTTVDVIFSLRSNF
jgi:TonB family protein